MTRKPPAEDPGDARLRVGPPKEYAAGTAAVTSSLRHAGEQMGARRSLLTLLQVRPEGGFDCSAWAESGAKAPGGVLRERRESGGRGGHRPLSPDFFAEHTLGELLP